MIAYETQERHHPAIAQLAGLNATQVDIRGACTVESLRGDVRPGTLIVSDCDGAETELLDPEAIPELASSTLIVEAHDLWFEGITPELRRRFEPTHAVEEIPTRERFVDHFPQLGDDIPLVTRQLAISEFRGDRMSFLVMRPR